ncbi:MAG: hypothetical protein M0R06_06515 [Sphaerochaeta sp.]|jgi:hypothetical protein|nr:hypothetical protein [Sphaerochaeta sp.]MDD4985135.1 hypothetical protein [Dehalococcoidales bacterium]
MTSFNLLLGKGLREPASPYRTAPVYGQPLNVVDADGWNALPSIVGSTETFDLRGVTPPCEIVVACMNVSQAVEGEYYFRFIWTRQRDHKKIYEFNWSYYATQGQWLYAYSYIGWVDWEIDGPGQYILSVLVDGPSLFSATRYITVTGSPAEPEPLPVIGAGLQGLADVLRGAGAFFNNLYIEVSDWIWPFHNLSGPFQAISSLFDSGARGVDEFNAWLGETIPELLDKLTWENIFNLVLGCFPGLEDVITWFSSWPTYIWDMIAEFWAGAQGWIRDLVQLATEGLEDLKAGWYNFFNVTLPGLVRVENLPDWFQSWLEDIQGLIDSAFSIREDLWEGWTDWRDKVKDFFDNPVEYIWNRFTDWFFGGK